MIKGKPLETNLEKIKVLAEQREDENYSFKSFLKGKDSAKLDKMVHRLNAEIMPQIDCTQCGNCCRTYMITLEKQDAAKLSAHLNMEQEKFDEKYLEISKEDNIKVFNKIPCHFLEGNLCTVYEARPNDCSSFPHLHKDGFVHRLFSVMYNYSICPIVFNVFERLKDEMHFRKKRNYDDEF
ncbi:MAG TPA: YkgJ family cysteine cluster protein [Chitinophagaceae bacterium]|nr:YkgJ family cysteine cluster protein [Chitinophagaceae bacterium]